ncbi:MAG: ATP-binding protein [Aphanizomenon gracile PMC649.10]|nr:ATP-binding protein [Aphanizomenon gracile PMC649.10]
MDSQEALNFIKDIFSRNKQEPLTELEENIFLGSWEKQEYSDIAAKTGYAEITLRDVGSVLWKKIKTELSIDTRFNKNNFRKKIEDYCHTNFTSSILSPTIDNKEKPNHNPISYSDNQNPFVPKTGRIENLEKFLGRDQEIKQIFELLNNASSVVLIGEQAIGKSSLLYAVYQQSINLLQLPRQNVFLDMNNIHNQEDFYFAICEKIDIPDSKGYRFKRNLENKRVLLVLDNVGKLNGVGFTRDVRDQLRGLAEGENACLKLVVAANESLKTLFNDSYETSPLADICQPVDIFPWDEIIIRDFITKRLQLTTIDFTEADIQELIQESGGHPQKLTQLCYNLYKKYFQKNNI